MRGDLIMRFRNCLPACLVPALGLAVLVSSAQDIQLDRTVTFTNLEGKVYTQLHVTHEDSVGVIWRDGAGGGRICYTNLAPALLEAWGIPTNRIAAARARLEQQAAAGAQIRFMVLTNAQQQTIQKAEAAADREVALKLEAGLQLKKAEAQAIEQLAARIEDAKLLVRKAKAAAHDFNQANRYNRLAPRVYVNERESVKIKEAELLLKRMKANFAAKYGEKIK